MWRATRLRIDLSPPGPHTTLTIDKVAHIYPLSDVQPRLECSNHIDVQCRVNQFPADKDDAIARLIFEKPGGTYACSGTLMNTTLGTHEPYILTARHCINTASTAASVSTRWFYRTRSCGGTTIDPRSTTTHGGADLLAESASDDMTLLKLRDDPPAGARFSGWDAEPLDFDAGAFDAYMLSHPGGGAMKYTKILALGQQPGYVGIPATAVSATIVEGNAEGGSSGGGVFKDEYLIGTHYGVGRPLEAVCRVGVGVEIFFNTLHHFYPQIKVYLDPELIQHGTLAYFLPGDSDMESVARIVSEAESATTVMVHAWDDQGTTYGPLEFELQPHAALHMTSSDLEQGDPDKGLNEGLGDGEGNWRLVFSSKLPINVTGYLNAFNGVLTAMQAVVPEADPLVYKIPFFAPHGTWSRRPRSWLRLVNPHQHAAGITINGIDDRGGSSVGTMNLTLSPRSALMLSDEQLELGDGGLDGSLGNGSGNWHLTVSATRPVVLMNLLKNPTGSLTNLSAGAPLITADGKIGCDDHVHAAPPPDPLDPAPPPPSSLPAPTGFTATVVQCTGVRFERCDGSYKVRLAWDWNPSEHDRTRVYRHTSNTFAGASQIWSDDFSDHDDESVQDGQTYYYWLRGETRQGVLSDPTPSARVKIP